MKKQYKVSIPKPCHEDWSQMTPKEKGRFCQSCSKTVVDFTKKSREEIQQYLSKNFGKRVCGHFNKRQLDTITIEIPSATFEQQLSFQKLFILALLFVMGTTLFSCQYSDGKKQKIEDVIVIDSLQKELDSVLSKECKTPSNENFSYLGRVPMTSTVIETTGITAIDYSMSNHTNQFHLDSITEIEEVEEIIEDVPITGETIEETTEVEGEIDLTIVGDIDYPDNEIEEDFILGAIIEEHPKFPEAKDISREKAREHFNQRVKEFFHQNFKAPQASTGVAPGKYRIISQFTIDKDGKITDIRIRAPHLLFEKETKRVLEKLPVFIPGKQRGKIVKTKYTLPLRIDVE